MHFLRVEFVQDAPDHFNAVQFVTVDRGRETQYRTLFASVYDEYRRCGRDAFKYLAR